MRMMLELLIPGMKNAEETDLGAEMPGIFSDFQKRLGARPEQQTIDDLFVLQSQWRQFVWQCENDMGVARGQQFGAPRVKPTVPRIALADQKQRWIASLILDKVTVSLRLWSGQCRFLHELKEMA
jgi:hypothetical protein